MDGFLGELQQHMDAVEMIGTKIECGETYMEDLKGYLPSLNQMVTRICSLQQDPQSGLELSLDFVLQVLNDIVYGMENKDSVFLLDVLRYGLLEIYGYIAAELQNEGQNEQSGL